MKSQIWSFIISKAAIDDRHKNHNTSYVTMKIKNKIKRPDLLSYISITQTANLSVHMLTPSNGNISALHALCAGNSPVTGEFPSQRPVTRALMISFICAWINGWVNNREAGDLRHHCAHYDVTVMKNGASRIMVKWFWISNLLKSQIGFFHILSRGKQ